MRLEERFTSTYGVEPTVIGSAPGRVNLIGEHLDYNGGRSLPIALPVRTSAVAGPSADGVFRISSLQSEAEPFAFDTIGEPGSVDGWHGYVVGVMWSLARLGIDVPALSLLLDGQVPIGSGLSSSAALECAVALAVCGVADVERSQEEIIAACVRAENDYVGVATGSMDQSISVYGRPGRAMLFDFAAGTRRPVRWNPRGELLVIDTGARHSLAGSEYVDRRRDCEAAARLLGVDLLATVADVGDALAKLEDPVQQRRARHVFSETARVNQFVACVHNDDWAGVGRAMTASHLSLRDDYEVSCAELDVAVEACLEAGAFGARMTGGGFGGSAIALVGPGESERVKGAVGAAYVKAGLAAPTFLDGTASAGASLTRL